MEKKGVSQIVTTILIILLVLAAIVIVWQAVKGTVEQGTSAIEAKTACMNTELSFAEGVSCVDNGDETVSISGTITRGADNADYSTNIKLVVEGTTNEVTAPDVLGSSSFTVDGVSGKENLLRVAPVVLDNNGEDVICDPTADLKVTCPTAA